MVARSHLLVLWSRLGGFDRNDLDALLWRERWLFEYWAHAASLVLTEDYPIHRLMMRAHQVTEGSQKWLEANDSFRRYVLDRLRDAGPADAPVAAALESLASFAAAGSVRYADPVVPGVS